MIASDLVAINLKNEPHHHFRRLGEQPLPIADRRGEAAGDDQGGIEHGKNKIGKDDDKNAAGDAHRTQHASGDKNRQQPLERK